MKKSDVELYRFNLRQQMISRRIHEIGKLYLSRDEIVPDLAWRETSQKIHSPAMIPPGQWMPLTDSFIPRMEEDSLIWLRGSFSGKTSEYNWCPCLVAEFYNDEPGGDREMVEGALWVDGSLYQGFDRHHREVLLPDIAPGLECQLTLRVYFKPHHRYCRVGACRLHRLHLPAYRFYQKMSCLVEVLDISQQESPRTQALLELMEKILSMIPFTDPGSQDFYRAIETAEERLTIPSELTGGAWATARVTGHAHIDLAWLWPVSETLLKVDQTFANACRLMEEYPHFTFIQSQPQLYEFARARQGDLFDKIKSYTAQGRWIPQGSTWVECDCNIPSGESLVRQFLYGRNYFRKHFDTDCSIFWVPDTFGFNGQIPQIMKLSGVDYFVTSKISWNQCTRFPHDSFRWQGIDGTTVLASFLNASRWNENQAATYNSMLNPSEVRGAWADYAQKDIFNEVIISYGYGDGGGGPTREMLERMNVIGGLSGIPEVTPGNPLDTFHQLEKIQDQLPRWRGELYLEYHRGTLTSRGEIKRWNRRAEDALNLLETAMALKMLATGKPAPPDMIEFCHRLWKKLLANQFHDIIAGSSIHPVNIEACQELMSIAEEAHETARQTLAKLWGGSFMFNPGSYPATGIITDEMPNTNPQAVTLKPLTGIHLGDISQEPQAVPLKYHSHNQIENNFYKAVINQEGEITSLVDLRNTSGELVEQGKTLNRLKFYQDRPMNWDAWDIDEYYTDYPLEGSKIIENCWVEKTPCRGIYRTIKRFRESEIHQDAVFYSHTPRIDFITRINWKNRNVLIKADFPFNINTTEGVYEIPFGFIRRPSHKNTLHDRAMFECAGQRWAAVFENSRGGAVLNDSKYGYSTHEGCLSITLLKSATYPDPDGEEGEHRFTYALLPCAASEPCGEILQEAQQLNCPPIIIAGDAGHETSPTPITEPMVHVECPENHVVASALKPSHNGRGVILRLYEAVNRRENEVTVTLPDTVREVSMVNLMEEDPVKLKKEENKVSFPIKPFQIITLLLSL